MNSKRYVFSVYKVFIRDQEMLENEFFTTYKEAKSYAIELKKCYPEIQIMSIKEVKVYKTSV